MRSSNFPPPDSYKPNYYPTKERMASFSFGSGKRSNFGGNSKTPAPGTYPITNRAVEGPRYNMGLKLDGQSSIGLEVKKTKGNPGAGTYNPDYTKSAKFFGAFSMKSRPINKDVQRAPGPGAYSALSKDKKRAPSFVFGSASQRMPLPPPTAPGPGNYNIPCSIALMPSHTGARSKNFAYI